jgi:hypothetical protein
VRRPLLLSSIGHPDHGLQQSEKERGQLVAIRHQGRCATAAKWYGNLPILERLMSELTSWIAVMNYTEMEAKVREATNNEP